MNFVSYIHEIYNTPNKKVNIKFKYNSFLVRICFHPFFIYRSDTEF
jgi:hypothetical protein